MMRRRRDTARNNVVDPVGPSWRTGGAAQLPLARGRPFANVSDQFPWRRDQNKKEAITYSIKTETQINF